MMKKMWQRLWPELRAYKSKLILVVILGAMTSALKGLAPELVNRLMQAWNSGDRSLALILPIILTIIWVISCVTRFFHLYLMKYTADVILVNIRRRLMDKYLSLNLSYFQEFERGSGGLISRMVNDINIIQTGIHKLADIFREPVMIVAMLGYVLYKDWMLTVFIMVALPIVTFFLRRIAISVRKYARQSQEIMEELTRTLKESLDGARIVQSFSLEGEMRRKFNEQSDVFLLNRSKIISREEAAGPISESLTMIFLGGLLQYIGFLVFNSSFTLGDFMGFMVAMGLLQDAIRKLQDGYIKLQQAAVGLDRLHEVLDSEPAVRDAENPVEFPKDWQKIEFQNVSFAYNENPVLKNINLDVHRNEKLALIGSSGSGKSTLVNLLQRFFDPTHGQVLIDGIDIKNFRLSDLRRNVALVTQDVFLFNDTITKNIQMGGLNASQVEVEESARLANAHDFILRTPQGYATHAGDFGSRMSGGEKQRISIARAILKNSPILVLDEATSALDSESELEVQKGLNQLLTGRTAFIIAHRLSTIAKADRIIVLRRGEIVEEGSHQQLLDSKGEYFKFHQMQAMI